MASASEIETFVLETSRNIRNLIYRKESKETIDNVKGKNVVMFMGMTKCGKSVIVNYLLGNVLVAKATQKNKFNIDKESPSSRGPAIGLASASETKIPTIWESTKVKELIVDCPGFDDNRGVEQDIASAFYIREIIVNAKTVKLVFVADINDILTENIGHFISFLDIIYRMLPKSDRLNHGMVLVFTKDNETMTSADVGELLNEKILNVPTIQVQNRQFVRSFKNTDSKIVITRMPDRAGVVDESKVFTNLVEVLNKTIKLSYHDISPVNPGISEKSKIFLLESHRYLSELQEFESVLNKIHNAFKEKLLEITPSANANDDDLNTSRSKLIELEGKIIEVSNIETGKDDKLREFRKMLPNVPELDEGSDLFMKLQIVSFVDSVLNLKENEIFNVKIDSLIANIKKDINLALIKVQEKLQELSNEEYVERIREINEENDNTVSEHENELRRLQNEQKNLTDKMKKSVSATSIMQNLVALFKMGTMLFLKR